MKLVTEANAHEFAPGRKRRGRPRKEIAGSNVISIADLRPNVDVDPMAEFYDRLRERHGLPQVSRRDEASPSRMPDRFRTLAREFGELIRSGMDGEFQKTDR